MMNSLTLREADESDYDHVVALMHQLNPDDPVMDRSVGLSIFKGILKNKGLTIFLADMEGQAVSTCYLNVIPNLTRGGQAYAVIENVITDVVHRRKGIGAELVKHAICSSV